MNIEKSKRIGTIENYYGGIYVQEDNGKYYWGIKNYDDDLVFEEISESFYNALLEYENNRIDDPSEKKVSFLHLALSQLFDE